ncbi:uncharacterized protein LOC130647547 [Hydractinia symbiolongicarpus]|uniref:uncharacterized protein LOC130647547 n=1 Tax=Hydractinia symbiolongicarpus TaxID=13093 RepID=UPI00254D82A6|nr:uncharacterized protein LOC130647547 [Hydractinia symbiolongicarpus]
MIYKKGLDEDASYFYTDTTTYMELSVTSPNTGNEIVTGTKEQNTTLDEFGKFDMMLDETLTKMKNKSVVDTFFPCTPSPGRFKFSKGIGKNALLPEDYLHSEVIFLRKELDNKQKVIDSLLLLLEKMSTILNYQGKNSTLESNKSANVVVNDSAINLKRSISTGTEQVDLTIQTCEQQLANYRKKCHSNYYSNVNVKSITTTEKNNVVLEDSFVVNNEDESKEDESVIPWKFGTTLVVGDSMFYGLDEQRMSALRNVKVRSFPGARVEDMFHYVKPLLQKKPDKIILHVGTNNTINETSRQILDKLLSLKTFINTKLPRCKVIFSSVIKRTDNAKAAVTVNHLNRHSKELSLNIIDNDNISPECLGKKGLHLSGLGDREISCKFY